MAIQCSIRTVKDIWTGVGERCPKLATTILRHNGMVVSHRCDEHAVSPFRDPQYVSDLLREPAA